MISSEVQRTLVKSPPELWAELSDPEALTRHLGALGEIRITRAEPEKLVEWEAERTSGVVRIKPSGWGTKVTLSVTREIPGPEEQAADADACADDHAMSGSEEPVPAEAEQNVVELEADALSEPKLEAEADPPPALEVEPETPGDSPEEEPELEPADAQRQSTKAEPLPEMIKEAPGSHRGFFARLFGRRRTRSVPREPTGSAHDVADAEGAMQTPLVCEPDGASSEPTATSSAIESLQARFAPAPATEVAGPDEPTAEPDPATPEPDPAASDQVGEQAEPSAVPPASIEPHASDEPSEEPRRGFFARLFGRPRAKPEGATQPQPAEAERPQAAEPSHQAPPAEAAADVPAETASAEPQPAPAGTAIESLQARFAPVAAEEPAELTGEEPESIGSQNAAEAPEAPPVDLAAELKAAEEVAAEEVTAVLTAVLDRLGAAHHRPFSRA